MSGDKLRMLVMNLQFTGQITALAFRACESRYSYSCCFEQVPCQFEVAQVLLYDKLVRQLVVPHRNDQVIEYLSDALLSGHCQSIFVGWRRAINRQTSETARRHPLPFLIKLLLHKLQNRTRSLHKPCWTFCFVAMPTSVERRHHSGQL
jgi:hypothetical protein